MTIVLGRSAQSKETTQILSFFFAISTLPNKVTKN